MLAMSTRHLNTFHRLLLDQAVYSVQQVDTNTPRYYLESPDGAKLILAYDTALDTFKVEGKINIESEVVTLTSYSRVAQLCFQANHSISWPLPFSGSDTIIRVACQRPYTSDAGEVLAFLDTTVSLIHDITSYLFDLCQACDLECVDASMFAGLDIAGVDLLNLAEQKQIQYGSWDNFMIAVGQSDIPAEDMEIAQKYLVACKEFEAKNPHLCLGEVARFLVNLVEEFQSNVPDRLEVN
jgi:hypothetical protein